MSDDKKTRGGGSPDYAICKECKNRIRLNEVHECPGPSQKGSSRE